MSISWRKLRKEILETCEKYTNVLIMVSGGVDSMFALDFIVRNTNIHPMVVHFQHGIREDDHREVSLIHNYCEKNDLEFRVGEGEGLAGIRNQEHEARNQRWKYVESIIESLDGSVVVITAHHYNDQIEHFLMSSSRGRSLSSLTMKHITHFDGYDKYKPLLDITKEEIYKQSCDRKLEFIEDPTNKELDHERNLFRNKIIPEMMRIRNLEKSMRSLFKDLSHI